MPKSKFQNIMFALITSIITVNIYVLFNLFVINGDTLMEINNTESVIEAVNKQGGIMMFGQMVPIWVSILTEIFLSFCIEVCVAGPLSFKIISNLFDIKTTHPIIFQTAIICTSIVMICPSMSLIVLFLYYPYNLGFSMYRLLINYLKFLCFNYPFTFFMQLFFIQPIVRTIFNKIFNRNSNTKHNRKNINREFAELKN